MNYFLRQCVFIVVLLIVDNFHFDCFNLTEIIKDLTNRANKGEIFLLENDTFTLDKDGYLGQGNYAIVWKGKKKIFL